MEGYWQTHYEVGTTRGDGIAMLHDGELLGGDLEHVWSGTYEEDGPRLYMRIRIVPYVSTLEEEIMARDQPIIVSLSGYCTEDFARLEGSAEHRKDLRIEIMLRKCKGAEAAFKKRAA
jgi:hypothetical protein